MTSASRTPGPMRGLAAPPVASAAAAIARAPLPGTGEQPVGGFAQKLAGGIPFERVEGPLPAPLLAHEPRVLELLDVVGHLRLAHAEVLLELADADALLPVLGGHARGGEVAAVSAVGHHGEHPHPYGAREGAAQGDESRSTPSSGPSLRTPFS